jgi:hypothetical protein
MTVMSPTDYKALLNDTFLKIGNYLQFRESIEIEIAKLKQLYYATLNLLSDTERVEFQKQVEELAGGTDEGLTEAIKNVLLAADGWMTTAMVRDKLRQVRFDFTKYGSNPLASIGAALRRWKAEEVECAQVEGVNAYRWKKGGMIPLSSMLKPLSDSALLDALKGLGEVTPSNRREPLDGLSERMDKFYQPKKK